MGAENENSNYVRVVQRMGYIVITTTTTIVIIIIVITIITIQPNDK